MNNEDSDEWNLAETDDDLDEIKPRRNNDDDIPIKCAPPIRNQTATIGNLFNQMVNMKYKLGLSWAKLSPSWDLKLELKLRFDAEV